MMQKANRAGEGHDAPMQTAEGKAVCGACHQRCRSSSLGSMPRFCSLRVAVVKSAMLWGGVVAEMTCEEAVLSVTVPSQALGHPSTRWFGRPTSRGRRTEERR